MLTQKEQRGIAPGPYLVISGHDFRSKRKANLHFIAEKLAQRSLTRFFSLGFSWLSKPKQDPRLNLWNDANRVATHNNVEVYLWKTLLHPINLRFKVLAKLEELWFKTYAKSIPDVLRDWVKQSKTIIIESGMGIILFDIIKKINPTATIIYIASDALDTIGCAPSLLKTLVRTAPQIDRIRIPSQRLTKSFPAGSKLRVIPHGIDHGILDMTTTSPYRTDKNIVSVGSMLFDRHFFDVACPAFPDVTFHVIGGGRKAEGLTYPNLILYGEMPFRETVAYIKHANAGVAPYQSEHVSPYLIDTSMKLMQYGLMGLPAICPNVVSGDYKNRFGYDPKSSDSIIAAIRQALTAPPAPPATYLSWNEVTTQTLTLDR